MSALEIDVKDEIESSEVVEGNIVSLNDFITDFGDGLLEAVNTQNPAVYDGTHNISRDQVLQSLKRKPFPAQSEVVQAATRLLIDHDQQDLIMNCEMGTGKTMMAIASSVVLHEEGYKRNLVLSPPHLCHKWKREILETVDNAKVWILNGPDTLAKLLFLRKSLGVEEHDGPEYMILGRVRMRMGFHWRPAYQIRKSHKRMYSEIGNEESISYIHTSEYVCCPECGTAVMIEDDDGIPQPVSPLSFPDNKRFQCKECNHALWTLMHPKKRNKTRREMVNQAMCQIPTIGEKTADKLISTFGEDLLSNMLDNNVYEFINLMNEDGELVFTDKQANRMERAMANLEFSFSQGSYQASEFIKRYLPHQYFSNFWVDESQDYKGNSSSQGQAMGVLASKCRKTILLTGTLMGGYSDDLFHLLWRINPKSMIEDGYQYNNRGSLGTASMKFMQDHGVLVDIYSESEGDSHKTSKGKRITHRIKKQAGFGPKGISRYVLPNTVFLKLSDIGDNVLPPYQEHFINLSMSAEQSDKYRIMKTILETELKDALRKGDKSLMGTVLQALLRWPDTCFREETIKHPRTRKAIFHSPPVIDEFEVMNKEIELIRICKENKARGRRVLAYTVYTGKHDTTTRLKNILQNEGFKVAVLRASVSTTKREDWIIDQTDRGVEVLICNPELVKTGLDLLEFPTICFMQTGYNVYTLQQASRRSWRIGQKQDVDVYYLGYEFTTQINCLELMAKKIAVSQSVSGEMPSSGLEILNQDGDSLEVALAKQLIAA